MSADPTEPLIHTSLFEEHQKLNGRLVPFAGYSLPVQYKGVAEEHRAVRTAAGLFDVSHMGELLLTGDGAQAVVDHLITNDLTKLSPGRALYTCCCNEQGTILDDLIVYCIAADKYLVVCNASNRQKIAKHFTAHAKGKCQIEDASDRTALLAFQGPKALEIVGQLGAEAKTLSDLKGFHFRDSVVANVRCTAARTGYTGEDGLELFCATEDAPQLWRALLEAGADHGAMAAGLGARDTLRLEARLSLYGNDIDETTNPIEAGLGWVVKLDKSDFVGKAALSAVKSAGPTRKLCGFEMVGRGIARHGYPLLGHDEQPIGICTSGSPGPTVGKNIGLGYLPIAQSTIDTRFWVDCRGRKTEAVVVKTPFYKRD